MKFQFSKMKMGMPKFNVRPTRPPSTRSPSLKPTTIRDHYAMQAAQDSMGISVKPPTKSQQFDLCDYLGLRKIGISGTPINMCTVWNALKSVILKPLFTLFRGVLVRIKETVNGVLTNVINKALDGVGFLNIEGEAKASLMLEVAGGFEACIGASVKIFGAPLSFEACIEKDWTMC